MPGYILIWQNMPDKREVDQLATELGIDHDSVVGKLVRFWLWAERQEIDCNAICVTSVLLDRLTNCPGFTAALLKVGWLSNRNGRLFAPNFDRKNGQTVIRRTLTKDRVQHHRNGKAVKTRNADVTQDVLHEENGGSLSLERDTLGITSSTLTKSSLKKKELYPSAFEEFWKVYPLRTAKQEALKAWIKAGKRIRDGTGKTAVQAAEHMRAAAEAFAASDKAKGEFCPHASTWLNGGRYDDDPEAWRDRTPAARKEPQSTVDISTLRFDDD